MQTQIQQILEQSGTKTSKIRQLINLGISRTEIARLLTNGNYGFVQNVYKKMQAEGQLNQITEQIASPSITPRIFDKEFGVEFEGYNVNMETLKNKLRAAGINCQTESYNHNTSPHWKIVTDGSLTGNQTFELVSPILRGEAGIAEMVKVCSVLNKAGAKVNKSCGTHVHINARNFTLEQWKRIYINYARLEKTIDGFMPDSRRKDNNTYCKGFSAVRNFETKITGANSLNEIERIFNSRYFKINPKSYSRHNTCEFRQHAGTTDFIKISSWVRFLSNLVDFSEENLIGNRTIGGLKNFNTAELTNYFEYRTLELAS
jgi:Putative amidoligase enzyme.